jgi:ABC-type transport system substrate-binding protein
MRRRPGWATPTRALAILTVLGVFLVGSMVSATSRPSSHDGPKRLAAVEPGGTITAGVVGATGAYDPHGWSGFTANIVNNHIYQGLVRLNFETGELEPALAESWENPDPTTYIYHLRDATFHDGTPVTADDVVFSVERAKELSWGAYGLSNLESVTALDDKTVEVKLTNPDWRFKYFFYWPPGSILSKSYFERVGDEEATRNPIGTNAFKLASSSESEIVLERFEDYWEEGLPYADRVILRVLDPTTIVTGLRTGEIQLSPDVGFDQLGFVSEFPNVDVMARVGPHLVLTAFNLEQPPFDDVKVRQAIAEALDNEAALSAYPVEFYMPSSGPMIHPSWQYSAYEDLKDTYTGDLEKARALLAESSVPDGFDVTWTVASTRPQELAAVLGAQERLAQIGINVNIEQIPDPDVAGRLYTRPRPFEMITYNWLHNQPNALDPMAALLTSANEGGTNWSGYSNPRFDELVQAATVATDEAAIGDAMAELQSIVIEDVPILIHGWDGIRRVSTTDLQTPPQTTLGQWDDWFRVSGFGAE